MRKTMVLAGTVMVLGLIFVGCPVNDTPDIPQLTGTVTVDGDPVVGQTLTANIAALGGTGTLFFQWERGTAPDFAPIAGATGVVYVVQDDDVDSTIRVVVTRAGYSGQAVSAPTAVVSDSEPSLPELTGAVTIDGDPVVGQTLRANITALGGTGTPSFRWERGTSPTAGETSASYLVQAADVNQAIRVVVTREGYSGEVIGGPTASVSDPSLPTLTGTVTIDGDPVVGQTLRANIDALGGTGTPSFRWERGTTPIAGEASASYLVQAADVNQAIRVVVTREGYSGEVIGGPTASVSDPSLPTLRGTVTIDGNPVVGQTLRANIDDLGGTGTPSFQWERGTAPNFTTIAGATGNTYIVQVDDANLTVRVVVTRDGYSGYVASDPSDVVPVPELTGTVTIDGDPVVGQTLRANIDALGGTGTPAYRWERGAGTDFSPIPGATGASYAVQATDVGQTIRVVVTREGYSGEVIGGPTGTVAHGGEFTMTFDFQNRAPNIQGPTVSILGGPETLTVSNPSDFDSIRWYFGGSNIDCCHWGVSGNYGETLTFGSNFHNNLVGPRYVTVVVRKDGVPYSRVITFTVVP